MLDLNDAGGTGGYKLERAELAIALPPDWKLDEESLKDERWYWPIGLLKVLARLPISNDTWLGCWHTLDKQSPFAESRSSKPLF